MKFGISVIICCFNSSKRFKNTLTYLANQKFDRVRPDLEIIVVDNASTDGTASSAVQLWLETGSDVPLRVIAEPRPGKANALEAGYNAADFELMLLCDDDNWLNHNYLNRVLELFSQFPEIGMLGGYGSEAYLGKDIESPDWFVENQHLYVLGDREAFSGFLEDGNYRIWGAGSVIRKSMWQFLKDAGFSFKCSRTAGRAQTEDAELSFMISVSGHRLYYDKGLTFIHDLSGGRIDLKGMIDQVRLNGKNFTWISHYKALAKMCRYNKTSFLYYMFYYLIGIMKIKNGINEAISSKRSYKSVDCKWNRYATAALFNKQLFKWQVIYFYKFLCRYKNDYQVVSRIYMKLPLLSGNIKTI